MLLEFSVENFMSIKDRVTLSMEAANNKELEDENVIHVGKYRLLRSAVLYGANASGKSNVLKAMLEFLRLIVGFSARERQNIIPFMLDETTPEKHTEFEIVFLLNQAKFRYGIRLSKKRIYSEWLFVTEKRERRMFHIEGERTYFSKEFKKLGASIAGNNDDHATGILFLGKCAMMNVEPARAFVDNLLSNAFMSLGDHNNLKGLTSSLMINSDEGSNFVVSMISYADLGIETVNYKANEEWKSRLSFGHRFLQGKDNIRISEKNESAGTMQLYSLSGPIYDSLKKGTWFVLDELENHLHPTLSRAIVSLFNSPKTNPNNAQLIFTTHNTTLLDKDLFRRDQIWFTEKGNDGATSLYSLIDFASSGAKSKDSFEKRYLAGRYGGVPDIDAVELADQIAELLGAKNDSQNQ